MSNAWIIFVSVGFGLVCGLSIGAVVGHAFGYDLAMDDVARVPAESEDVSRT